MARTTLVRRFVFPSACALVLLAWLPGSQVDYVLTQAVYQAGMLLARQPVADVLGGGELDDEQRASLERVEPIRAFALVEVGLAPLRSYTSVAVGFDRTMYNLLAAQPDRFEVYGRWFPVVGAIPYIGYFRRADTEREARRLRAAGLDVDVRPVGAYSTLGWFDDPLLPGMLRWPEHRLADTLIHESAHATLFLPGQMAFNESFARFVGNRGAEQYMETRRAVAPEARRAAQDDGHDRALLVALLVDLVADLELVYASGGSRANVLERKHARLQQAAAACHAAPFRQERYAAWFDGRDVNNATLMTFRTYNTGEDAFAALLADHGGDLGGLVAEVTTLADRDDDGFEWLSRRTGIRVEDPTAADRR